MRIGHDITVNLYNRCQSYVSVESVCQLHQVS